MKKDGNTINEFFHKKYPMPELVENPLKIKEFFHKKYPTSTLIEKPLNVIEAIGWLKCIRHYMPYMAEWVDIMIDSLSRYLKFINFEKEE